MHQWVECSIKFNLHFCDENENISCGSMHFSVKHKLLLGNGI